MTAAADGVAGLLLAAGAGRRMGGPKALLPWGDELLVEHGARLLAGAGCTPVIVVLGCQADEVRERAALTAAATVTAADWETGLAASLRAGLAALADGPGGAAVVALVDQPGIGGGAVRRLVDAWRAGAVAAVATYAGLARNPVLLDRAVWPEVVAAAEGDVGARAWLGDNSGLVTPVACDGTGDPTDVDTPADYAALAARICPRPDTLETV